MNNIRALTQGYGASFDARDIDAVANYFAPDFVLTDPEVTNLTPMAAARDYVGGLFDANPALSFVAHNIVVDGDISVIHFTLTMSDTVLDGIDLIRWQGAHMAAMHAYLSPRSV